MRALLVLLLVGNAATAHADRELCRSNARYRGTVIDLDVKNAEIAEVFRFLSDVARVNVVLSDDVSGKVTLKLKRVPWDQVACTIAAMKQLVITVDGNVLLVMPQPHRAAGG